MSSDSPQSVIVFCLLLLISSTFATFAIAQPEEPEAPPPADGTCAGPAVGGKCHSVPKALRLKLIAIPAILVASMVGVCLPLFSRSVPALRPDRNLFIVVKAFASGVILGTGYMHVLPDSFNDLSSPCLPRRPWSEFPFTTFVAMLAALFTLLVDSLMLSFYNRRKGGAAVAHHGHDDSPPAHCHGHGADTAPAEAAPVQDKAQVVDVEASNKQLLRNRVIVQVTMHVPLTQIITSHNMYRIKEMCNND